MFAPAARTFSTSESSLPSTPAILRPSAMSDIRSARLRLPLQRVSCCHSACAGASDGSLLGSTSRRWGAARTNQIGHGCVALGLLVLLLPAGALADVQSQIARHALSVHELAVTLAAQKLRVAKTSRELCNVNSPEDVLVAEKLLRAQAVIK
mgnify:CR=1 FL=1